MIQSLRPIWGLYAKQPVIGLAVTIFLGALLSSLWALSQRYDALADDFFTLLLMSGMWLSFHFGILLKSQFTRSAASLLPHYRSRHLIAIAILLSLGVMMIFCWGWLSQSTLTLVCKNLAAVFWGSLFFGAVLMWLGYLSIPSLLLYAYAGLMILAIFFHPLLAWLDVNTEVSLLFQLAFYALLGSLVMRLFLIKEERWEFDYLLSWPIERMTRWRAPAGFIHWGKIFKSKTVLEMPPFPRAGNLLAQAQHWNRAGFFNYSGLWVVMLLLWPAYSYFFNSDQSQWLRWGNPFANFLLLSTTPVLLLLWSQPRRLSAWGYDLLKPITRRQWSQQMGLSLLVGYFECWLLFVICFGLLPQFFVEPEIFGEVRFWILLLLTGVVGLVALAWLLRLSCVDNVGWITGHGFLLGMLLLFMIYSCGAFTVSVMLGQIAVLLMMSGYLLWNSFQGWLNKDYWR